MPRVNHEILGWARETAGITREEAVKKLDIRDAWGMKAVDRLTALESGEAEPTRPTLVKMAKQYRRPLLTFYLSAPPRKGDRGTDFRTLPGGSEPATDAILDTLIRETRARQSMVRAVLEDEDEAAPLPFVHSKNMSDGQPAILTALKTLLDVSVRTFHAQPRADTGFELLRTAAEAKGVYVLLKGDLGNYHTAMDTEVFRGFTVADEVAPFIVLNDRDARPAWSFSLLHELVYLILGQSGLSNELGDSDMERLCDDVAGGFLLPNEDLDLLEVSGVQQADPNIERRISDFADDRNLSRSVVAYRAYRADLISRRAYSSLNNQFRQQWQHQRANQRERNRHAEGGPNYYVIRRHRTGQALISFARQMMGSGALSTSQVATVLGVKLTQVGEMLNFG